MFSKYTHSLWLVAVFALLLSSCQKKDDPDPTPPVDYNPTYVKLDLPKWVPLLPKDDDNALTEEGIRLGRKLYYDPELHKNGVHACASCHEQGTSFSSNPGGTAVLAHINLGWSDAFLWNGKVEGSLEDIMLFEVAEFSETDVDRLGLNAAYAPMFYDAFGDSSITHESCSKAMAQFVRSMTSFDSHYDRYTYGDELPTPDEYYGEMIFNSEAGDCFHCHTPPLFTDNSFHNTGLDSTFEGEHQGRFLVTRQAADMGLFKTPTLRNIAVTGPYMHDGRFETLEEVIEHYNSGVHASNTLDPIMTKVGKEKGLMLSEEQKQQLIAFLKALTDSSYMSNSAYGPPQDP